MNSSDNGTFSSDQEANMFELTWPQAVFHFLSLYSLPLYIWQLVTIIKYRKKIFHTTFYALTLSQGLADILSVINFYAFVSVKNYMVFNDFYFGLSNSTSPFRYFSAAWSYNNIYYFLFVRCFGIVLISVQRQISICGSNELAVRSNSIPTAVVFIIHWLVPTIISSPIFLNSNLKFNNRDELVVKIQPLDHQRNTLITTIYIIVTFTVSFISYIFVLRLILSKRLLNSRVRRELRLYTQILGLALVFVWTLVHYVMSYLFSVYGLTDLVTMLRIYYPCLVGVQCYINSWCLFILNKELRGCMLKMINCQSTNTVQDIQQSMVSSNNKLNATTTTKNR